MIQLLKKEFQLTASPLSYLFIGFSLLTFIPQYPILVGAFFVCFGVFQTFQKAREANDTLYSCLLPIKKTDIVKAKFAFTISVQMVAFILITIFTLLRLLVFSKAYSTNSMMNANLAYLGYVLIVYAWFNIFFVGGFFKTAYKIGIPFLIYAIIAFVTIIIGETLHFIPALGFINDNFHWSQLIIFFLGIVIYVVGTFLSIQKSKNNFEKIDL